MTKVDMQRIFVTGMACSMPYAEDLAGFWACRLNGKDSGNGENGAVKVIDLLRDTINRALLDAGITEASSLAGRIELVILLDGGKPIPDALVSPLNEELRICKTVSFASMKALHGWFAGLRTGQKEALVLASVSIENVQDLFRTINAISAGAVVLQRESKSILRQPYGSIRVFAGNRDDDLGQLYAAADIAPARVGMLELYCIGKQLPGEAVSNGIINTLYGDDDVLGRRPLGFLRDDHLRSKSFSWLTGLIEALLCLHNKIIPPAGAGRSKEDRVLPEKLPFYINLEPRPWIYDKTCGPRLAALSSTGTAVGHCVVEEYVPTGGSRSGMAPRPLSLVLESDSELILLGADDQAGLVNRVDSVLRFLDRNPGDSVSLKDVAATMIQALKPVNRCRLVIICSSLDELQHYLQIVRARSLEGDMDFADLDDVYFEPDARQPGRIACIFPGQGFPGLLGPYADHLYSLCQRFPAVREVFDSVEKRDNHPRDPDLTSQVFFPPASFADKEKNRLRHRLAAPRLSDFKNMTSPRQRDLSSFGISVANRVSWILLQELGVKADMIFGQSHGELSALCAAGCLDFPDVIASHWQIEYDPEELEAGRGRLVLASADAKRLAPLLEQYEDVTVAVHVSPSFQILGGDVDQLEKVVAELRRDGVWTQMLPYPAIHTPRFTSLRSLFEPFLKNIEVHPYKIPVYSGMICDLYPQERDSMLLTMVDNLDHPLYLWQTTRKMYEDGARIFIQVGGGATMHTQARANIGADDVVPLALDVDYRTATRQLNHLCGALFINGINLDYGYLYRLRNARILDMKSAAVQKPLQAPSAEPRLPFVGEIKYYREHGEIIVQRVLDLSEDHFLAHHLFINAPDIKPINARAPVMPLTVSIELMAEVASCLAPGYGIIGFGDIKTNRWIELEDSDTLELEISARLQNVDPETGVLEIGVAVYVPQQERAAVEALVRFGQQYQLSVELGFADQDNLRPYPVSAAAVYGERRLFHGPLFQCVSGTIALGENSVFGELAVLPKDTMFTSLSEPELLTDPILLDGVGQLIGLWAIDKGVYVFPITIQQVEFYCPTPPVGTTVPVQIEITDFSSKFLYADVEIQDGSGHVWMRIKGWGDWVFRWTERIYNFWRQPTRYCTSHALQLESSFDGGHSARLVAKSELRDMDLTFMARFYLHMTEMVRFKELAGYPERQMHWFLGRIAAKDAVRCLLMEDGASEMLHPASFVIENDTLGRPLVRELAAGSSVPHVTIAHCRDRAVALAAEEPVAVDIEEIRERDDGFLESFTSEDERNLLREISAGAENLWLTRLWCAKEVAGKLLGTGVDTAPQKFKMVAITDDGKVTIRPNKNMEVAVHTFCMDDFVVAYAAGRRNSTGKVSEKRQRGRAG